jgi:hypothetical protein
LSRRLTRDRDRADIGRRYPGLPSVVHPFGRD